MEERQDEAWRGEAWRGEAWGKEAVGEDGLDSRTSEPAEKPHTQDEEPDAPATSIFATLALDSDTLHRVMRLVLRGAREIAETLVPAVIIALVIHLFLAQATKVLGQSMEPTLHTQQMVVMEKATYRFFHGPRRGDVVVIDLYPQQTTDDPLIKRVIGLPGETIEVRGGEVYIDGELLDEPWTTRPGGSSYSSTTIPPLHIFVMGDNRGASNDSRNFGPIHINQIVGRAWFSYWPPEYIGIVE